MTRRPVDVRKPPIFVVGLARSGTTLLQGLLGAHPGIAAPPEVYFFFRLWETRRYWGDLNDDERLRAALHECLDLPYLDQFDEQALFERLLTEPRNLASVLDVVMSDYAYRQGNQRWSEKTPGQWADMIWEAFPEAQVLHIVRDPREMVASQLGAQWETFQCAAAARAWTTHTAMNMQAGRRRGPSSYLRLLLEDLTQDPVAVMRQVYTFLGEPIDDAAVRDSSRRAGSIIPGDAWQERVLEPITASTAPVGMRLSRADRLRVVAATSALLPGLGYPVPRRRAVLAGKALLGRRPRPVAVEITPEEHQRRVKEFVGQAITHWKSVGA